MKSFVKNSAIFVGGSVVGIIFGALGMVFVAIKSDRFRSALSKTISDKIADILYEEKKPRYHNVYHKNRTINYRYYINADDISFDSLGEAQSVLKTIKDIASTYGFATLTDLYDAAGLRNDDFLTNKFGWTESELKQARIVRDKNKRYFYITELPRAREIA